MTQKSEAQKGNITPEMEFVAQNENIDVKKLAKLIDKGLVVIPKNVNGHSKPCGIGEGLTTKINANIGSSSKIDDLELEINKAKLAQEYGADALMDLSTGSDLKLFRQKIMEEVDLCIGTVPIYEAGVVTLNKNREIIDMDPDDIFKAIENQAKEGVDRHIQGHRKPGKGRGGLHDPPLRNHKGPGGKAQGSKPHDGNSEPWRNIHGILDQSQR